MQDVAFRRARFEHHELSAGFFEQRLVATTHGKGSERTQRFHHSRLELGRLSPFGFGLADILGRGVRQAQLKMSHRVVRRILHDLLQNMNGVGGFSLTNQNLAVQRHRRRDRRGSFSAARR